MERTDTGMWRYRDVLSAVEPVSLGEGGTPLLRSRRYPGLWIKDEGANPSGSWLARAASVAVSIAKQEGRHRVQYRGPSADVVAAYAAAADLALVVPQRESASFAARVHLAVFGVETGEAEELRLAPDRTLGLELAQEGEGWDAILVPAPMEDAGLTEAFAGHERRPEVMVVCEAGTGDEVLRFARQEGILLGRAGAACVARYEKMLRDGSLSASSRVVVVNPEAAWRDDQLAEDLQVRRPVRLPVSLPVGGIITPV